MSLKVFEFLNKTPDEGDGRAEINVDVDSANVFAGVVFYTDKRGDR